MPTRFIHSRSALMPSLVMLPFIQCHQTRGLALSGGFWKPCWSASPEFCAETIHAPTSAVRRTAEPACVARLKSCIYVCPLWFQCNPYHPAREEAFGAMPELVRFLEEIPMRSSTHKLAEQLTEEGLPPDTLGVARAERLRSEE